MATQQTRSYSVYAYFVLTNLTQVPYRTFLSVLQCISNQQSSQIKALVKYNSHHSALPANHISNYSSRLALSHLSKLVLGKNMGTSTEAKTDIN